MIWLIVTIVIAVVGIVLGAREYFGRRYYPDFIDFFVPVLFISILGNMVWMFICVVISCIGGTTAYPEDASVRDIQAIKTNSGTEAGLFLGSGTIDEEQSYLFYAKNADGSFYMDSVPADEVTIVESDSETPNIARVPEVFNLPIFPGEMRTWDSYYVITVPNNSIEPMIDMSLPD